MKVLNLCCASDHRFEGWFSTEDDYRSQVDGGLLACPLCGDTAIRRLPSAPHVITSTSRSSSSAEQIHERAVAEGGASSGSAPAPTPVEMPANAVALQSAWLRAVQHVIQNTDDVGPRFAEEARRMHYGETDERPIRGQATSEEAQSLHEEGIEVMSLPMPAALKGPVQ